MSDLQEIEVKKSEDINLDIGTQNDLSEMVKAINEIQIRLQLVIRAYIRANGKSGDYSISKDFTKLVLIEENK